MLEWKLLPSCVPAEAARRVRTAIAEWSRQLLARATVHRGLAVQPRPFPVMELLRIHDNNGCNSQF